MVRTIAKRGATYADLEALPDHVVGELVAGDLVVSPRPRPAHAEATGEIHVDLSPFGHRRRGGPGGWRIVVEPELHLRDDVVVPDLAGWRIERMPAMPTTAFYPLAPDWLCEVLSPSTRSHDRTRKLPLYAREGVTHVWFVEPEDRTIEVFRLTGDVYALVRTISGDDPPLVRIEPFDALELDVSRWWAEAPAP